MQRKDEPVYEAAMKGKGPMLTSKIAAETGYNHTSVNQYMRKVLVPSGRVKRTPTYTSKNIKAFLYTWIK